jgi:DNA adenine methylase
MWAGGKNKMIPKYLESPGLPYKGYDTYVEPFFGGGAMMIHIAEHVPSVKKFILNDINPEIVGLYTAIKNDVTEFMSTCDALCAQYIIMPYDDRKKFFYEIRKKYTEEYADLTPTQEAGVLYFLMKTAFNGIFQSTIAAKGRFCTPCGLLNHKTQVYDKENVLEWHTFLQNVDIFSGDWKDCVNKIDGTAFYFLDPPYRGSFTQYGQDFTDDKQIEIIDFCKEAAANGHMVMFCNRDIGDSFYKDHKDSLCIDYYSVTYTVGRRATEEDGSKTAKAATEILLYNKSLKKIATKVRTKTISKVSKKKKEKVENNFSSFF